MQFITQNQFRKEIMIVIALKLAALFLLWWLFFSHPIADSLEKHDLAKRYMNN